MSPVNAEQHATCLADLLEQFVCLHSGTVHPNLPALLEQSVDAIDRLRRDMPPKQFNLKSLIKLAVEEAARNGEDPYGQVLKVVGSCTKKWERFATEDQEVYLDIKDWLEWESEQEIQDL
jgi:hypothetical protein